MLLPLNLARSRHRFWEFPASLFCHSLIFEWPPHMKLNTRDRFDILTELWGPTGRRSESAIKCSSNWEHRSRPPINTVLIRISVSTAGTFVFPCGTNSDRDCQSADSPFGGEAKFTLDRFCLPAASAHSPARVFLPFSYVSFFQKQWSHRVAFSDNQNFVSPKRKYGLSSSPQKTFREKACESQKTQRYGTKSVQADVTEPQMEPELLKPPCRCKYTRNSLVLGQSQTWSCAFWSNWQEKNCSLRLTLAGENSCPHSGTTCDIESVTWR